MTDTLEAQVATPYIALTCRMGKHKVSRCAKRIHKMGADETISPRYENSFSRNIQIDLVLICTFGSVLLRRSRSFIQTLSIPSQSFEGRSWCLRYSNSSTARM